MGVFVELGFETFEKALPDDFYDAEDSAGREVPDERSDFVPVRALTKALGTGPIRCSVRPGSITC